MLRLEEILDQEIYDEGIYLEEDVKMPGVQDGIYYSADDMPYPIIAITPGLRDAYQKNYIKAHELGHHYNCICNLFEAPAYIRRKYELLADRHWVNQLMSVDHLITAYEAGVCNPFELSEYLQLPIDVILKGLKICYQENGPISYKGQYCIYWNPLDIKIDHRRCTA